MGGINALLGRTNALSKSTLPGLVKPVALVE